MSSIDESILKTAKEIVVKFIETGRVSPSGFKESFENIYNAVKTTVIGDKEEDSIEAAYLAKIGKKDKL